jgi:putative peptidoglycan lipid II flippase
MSEPETPTAKGSVWLRFTGGWNRWTGASVNRSIFGAALTVAAFTVVAKLVSVGKELVVAGSFGTGDALDAYLIAFLLPSFTISVVAGSFNAALIPTFIKVRDWQGPDAAQRLLSGVMFWTLVLLGAAMLVLFASARWVLPLAASGFSAEKLALTRGLFYLLLPVLVLSGFSTIWSAILNAGQTFALPALVPVITPSVTIAAILLAGKTLGIYAVAGATLGGAVVEMGFLGWKLKQRGYALWPRRHPGDPAAREVLGQYLPMVAGALLMSSTLVVDQSMAAMLGPGSVAALTYGNRIVGFFLNIGSMAVGTAVLPYFSRMVAARDWVGVKHTLKSYARLILLVTVPVALMLVFGGKIIVSLLYERGKFTATDTILVSQIQAFYALQIPFYILGIMVVRLISSLRANHILMWGAVISLALDVSLNYALMKRIGVAGIGLSNSIVYLVSLCYLLTMLSRQMRHAARGHG